MSLPAKVKRLHATPPRRDMLSACILLLVVIITIRRFVPTYIPVHWNYGTFLRQERPSYPPTRRDNTSDVYKSLKWGTVRVPDPYRWLENDDNCRQDWASNQEAFTARHFSAFQDQRQLNETVAKAHDYTTFSTPWYGSGDRWYWTARVLGQEQTVLYRSPDNQLPKPTGDSEDERNLYFDTNILSKDGSKSLTSTVFAPDGQLVAYAVATTGADNNELLICHAGAVRTQEDLDNALVEKFPGVWFGYILWTDDSKGFYYSPPSTLARNGSGPERGRILYHAVHSDRSNDRLVVEGKPGEIITMFPSNDGDYMLISSSRDTTPSMQLWISPKNGESFDWVILNKNYLGSLAYVTNDGPTFTFLSSIGSDRPQLASWKFDPHNTEHFKRIDLPMDAADRYLLQYLPINNDYSVAVYLKNVRQELYVMGSSGDPVRLDDNFDGSITVSYLSDGFFATFDGYTTPPVIKKWQLEGGEPTWSVWRRTEYPAVDLSRLTVSQVWYNSMDGTLIPMFILHHKGIELNGSAPLLQYGYGGNDVSLLPSFSPTWVTFVTLYGGVVAFPNIRGGSEFGANWANAGKKRHIMNGVSDFVSATQYLALENYIARDKASILGWSAGGALVIRSIASARSGTFKAAISDKGAHDTLRFPLFDPGVYWIGALGDPDQPADFDYIYPVAPLYKFPSNKQLPDTLILAGGSDVRINKMHTYKMLATLQHNAPQGSGIQLLKTIPGEGHDPDGKSHTLQVEDDFTVLAFIANSLRLKPYCCD